MKDEEIKEEGKVTVGSLKCDFCDKEFNQTSNLRTHIKRNHEINKNEKCEFCKKYFISISSLNRHMKHVHCKNKVDKFPSNLL